MSYINKIKIGETTYNISSKYGYGMEIDSEGALSIKLGDGLKFNSDKSVMPNLGDGLSFGMDSCDGSNIKVNVGSGLKISDTNAIAVSLGTGLGLDEDDILIFKNGRGLIINETTKNVDVKLGTCLTYSDIYGICLDTEQLGAGLIINVDDNNSCKLELKLGTGLSVDEDGVIYVDTESNSL